MNEKPAPVDSARPTDCRLLVDPPATGARNMAVDEVLLFDAAENGLATLRFYEWNEPTLSLGYFQRHDDRSQHKPSRNCPVVRRQTGGGAILHDRELTYSIALPAIHPLSRQTQQLYGAVHDAIIAGLRPALAAGSPRWNLRQCVKASGLAAADEPFLCFQRRALGDVLLVPKRSAVDAYNPSVSPPPADWKILGSAQRRHCGAVLQHGSLLLAKSPAAPELSGLSDLADFNANIRNLAESLGVRFAAALGVRLSASGLPPRLELKAEEFANNKYAGSTWTNRR